MAKEKQKITQLRLLLPETWISELDNLAASRFLTRLGLIRFYLRAQMDEDLLQLQEYFKTIEAQKRTHKLLSERLTDLDR
jgi:hypothetical protein